MRHLHFARTQLMQARPYGAGRNADVEAGDGAKSLDGIAVFSALRSIIFGGIVRLGFVLATNEIPNLAWIN